MTRAHSFIKSLFYLSIYKVSLPTVDMINDKPWEIIK